MLTILLQMLVGVLPRRMRHYLRWFRQLLLERVGLFVMHFGIVQLIGLIVFKSLVAILIGVVLCCC
jgi:hypothetical protein